MPFSVKIRGDLFFKVFILKSSLILTTVSLMSKWSSLTLYSIRILRHSYYRVHYIISTYIITMLLTTFKVNKGDLLGDKMFEIQIEIYVF